MINKKIYALLLTVILILAFSACGSNTENDTNEDNTDYASGEYDGFEQATDLRTNESNTETNITTESKSDSAFVV